MERPIYLSSGDDGSLGGRVPRGGGARVGVWGWNPLVFIFCLLVLPYPLDAAGWQSLLTQDALSFFSGPSRTEIKLQWLSVLVVWKSGEAGGGGRSGEVCSNNL